MEVQIEGSVSEGDMVDTDSTADPQAQKQTDDVSQAQADQEPQAELQTDNEMTATTESVDTPTDDDEVYVDPAVLERLTTGVLGLFLPNLQKAKGSLNEALHNQEVLIETVQQENAKFTDSVAMKQLTETMHEARVYHTKLISLKREMNTLMERSTKLKRRAVKLQQQKQKDELTRAVQQERELERERMLTAKVAKTKSEQPLS